ncbi:MAG: hypothetical protein V8R55_08905 [Dysosmobacter sp.]
MEVPGEKTPVLESVSLTPEAAAPKAGQTPGAATAAVRMSDGSTDLPEGSSVVWEVANGRSDEVSVTAAGPNSLIASIEALAVPETTQDPTVAGAGTVTPPPGAGEARMDTCSVTVNAADPTGVTVTPTTLEPAGLHRPPHRCGISGKYRARDRCLAQRGSGCGAGG